MGVIQPGEEMAGVNNVLNAAALTYVAAFIAALGNLLWLLSLRDKKACVGVPEIMKGDSRNTGTPDRWQIALLVKRASV